MSGPILPWRSRGERGFALIIVLWTLVLIAFVTVQVVASGRVETRIAGNLASNAVTAAAADGAVYQAAFNQFDPQPDRRWPLDGEPHELALGDCRVIVRLTDETALINPNVAAPQLVEALLRITGTDAEQARRLAVAIGEWAGATGDPQSEASLLAEYRAAGLDYAPPGEPFETLGELRRVLGMTPAIYAAIRPHLSLFAPAVPNLNEADPVVAAAMQAVDPRAIAGAPVQAARNDVVITRIAADARGPNQARATRTAVFQIVPRSGTYVALAWDAAEE